MFSRHQLMSSVIQVFLHMMTVKNCHILKLEICKVQVQIRSENMNFTIHL